MQIIFELPTLFKFKFKFQLNLTPKGSLKFNSNYVLNLIKAQ
jgi:hypothetical protein